MAAGRVIRTETDQGVVHLIDDRFSARRSEGVAAGLRGRCSKPLPSILEPSSTLRCRLADFLTVDVSRDLLCILLVSFASFGGS